MMNIVVELQRLFKGVSIKDCDSELEPISTHRLRTELKRRNDILMLRRRLEKINNAS
ncbi:hypothetical protein LGL08_20010 [Clostridium estertheticum]|nr:hypothetical protein [Clostridium estertheticum]MCB2351812.1 hypothetical protein [Clostridium estertheticum]